MGGTACIGLSLSSLQPDQGKEGRIFFNCLGWASLILGGGGVGVDGLANLGDLLDCFGWGIAWDSGDDFFLNTMVVVPASLVQ